MICKLLPRIAAAAFASLASAGAEAQDAASVPEAYVALAKDVLMTSIHYRTVEGAGQMRPYAEYLAGVLREGGFAEDDIRIEDVAGVTTLVAVLRGESPEGAILLSGHMDVVAADPEDWERDPFVPVEENGFIYGRGSLDMKHGIAEMVATLVRLKQEGFRPARDIVLVLSGDEETAMASTAALAEAHAGASLLLNADAGGGLLSEDGEPVAYYLQAAEKTYADFRIEIANPGGHSSMPRADNAIYGLARALARIEAYAFPPQTSEITRAYFEATGGLLENEVGEAMLAFVRDPADAEAIATLRAQPEFVGQLGTTCVATMLDAGHAPNALPQRATANVNCRIFPGVDPESVRQTLVEVIDDPAATVAFVDEASAADASPLREDVMAAVRRAVDRRYPGLPVIPQMSAGATDSLHFRARGVPSYGVSGIFIKASDEFAHGLDERVPADNLAPALDHWHVLLTELGR